MICVYLILIDRFKTSLKMVMQLYPLIYDVEEFKFFCVFTFGSHQSVCMCAHVCMHV